MTFGYHLDESVFQFDSILSHLSEWVGDLDSENAGRLGLWQVCQRDEMIDNCQKELIDFLSIPSIPFQVSRSRSNVDLSTVNFCPLQFKQIYFFSFARYEHQIGGHRICWTVRHHGHTHHIIFSVSILFEIDNGLPHLWMDANSLR